MTLYKNIKNYYYNQLTGCEIFNPDINNFNYCIKEFESNPIFNIEFNDFTDWKIRDISLKLDLNKLDISDIKSHLNNWIYSNDNYFLLTHKENSYIINKNDENNIKEIFEIFDKKLNLDDDFMLETPTTISITSLYRFDNLILLNPLFIIQEIYFIDKFLSLNKLNGGLTFESEFTNDILDFIKNADIKNKLKNVTYGDLNHNRIYDDQIRKCKYFDSKITVNLDIPFLSDKIHFVDTWEYLQYDEGGIFNKHIDRKRNKYHDYTVLLYPPYDTINSYGSSNLNPTNIDSSIHLIGGDLILYPFGENSENFSIKIKVDKTKWICVVFPINITHESTMVNQGNKCLFKGIGLSKK